MPDSHMEPEWEPFNEVSVEFRVDFGRETHLPSLSSLRRLRETVDEAINHLEKRGDS